MLVAYSLNPEGAPWFFFNLAKGLKKLGHKIEILSPIDGMLKGVFQSEKIQVITSDFTSKKFDSSKFEDKYDIVLVNTIIGYKFLKKINLKQEKIIWCLHESERDFYFNYFPDLNTNILSKVSKVVFSSIATRDIYEDLNIADNFTIINTVGDWGKINNYTKNNSKEKIKKKYGFKKSDFLINLIGTICLRKGQLEFMEAAITLLRKLKNPNLKFIMVGGGRGYEYEKEIRKKILLNNLEDQILIFNETKDIFDFYFISDIFVCNSYIEAFPMVTLEAMAFGLPIVSTDAYGLAEQFEDGKNGLVVMPGDTEELKNKITYLIKNPDIAKKLGKNARKTLEERFSYDKMIKKYDSLISEVYDHE